MSPATLLRSLHASQPGIKDKTLLLAGTMRHPRSTRRWLGLLGSHPTLTGLARRCPRLGVKIYRPYLSAGLDCSARTSALIAHYRLLVDAGFTGLIDRCASEPVAMAQFVGKSGAPYRLELFGGRQEIREGELFLRLMTGDTMLYRLAFTLVEEGGRRSLRVGCVQGLRADDAIDAVRTATRDLYACRPKNLLIAVARDMGNYFGCDTLIGVANANQVAPQARRLANPGTDYDETWQELGAMRRADGDHELPCSDILRTSYDDLPSKKRSEARKRTTLLQEIFEQVRDSMEKQRNVFADAPPQ